MKKLWIISFLLLSVLVLGGCKAPVDQSQITNLAIKVRDTNNQQVAANIKVLHAGEKVASKQGSEVKFELLKNKNYKLEVDKEGYLAKTVNLPLEEDSNLTVKLIKVANLVGNGDFTTPISNANPKANGELDSGDSWVYHQNSNGQGSVTIEGGEAKVKVNNPGNNPWSVQLLQGPITLEKSAYYKISFEAHADQKAKLHLKLGANGNRGWVGYEERDVNLTTTPQTYQFKFVMEEETDQQARFELWFLNQTDYTIDNIKLIKIKSGTATEQKDEVKIESGEIITNGSFANKTVGWGSDGNIELTNQAGKLKAKIESIGDNSYTPQVNQKGIKMVKDVTYTVSFTARANKARKMNVAIGKPLNQAPWYIDYIGEVKTFDLTTEMKNYKFRFTMKEESYDDAKLTFELGQITDGSAATTVYLDNVRITPDLGFYTDSSLTIDKRVSRIISLMTLDEKIGQMTQGERRHVSPKQVRKYHLGSILSGGGSTPGNNTPQDWIDMYNNFQEEALSGRLELPLIYGVDAVHGHNNLKGATIFPHNIGLGAMGKGLMEVNKSKQAQKWIEKIARISAQETAATGMDWDFAPAVSVVRDERWGRSYESFGETAELQKLLAGPYVKGLQGTKDILSKERGHVVATAKHFIGDGATKWETGDAGYQIDRGNVNIDLNKLKKLHGQGYLEAIDENVGTIMISYNSYQGTKMHAHQELIQNYLKAPQKEGGLGFDGFVISDWAAIHEIDAPTHYAKVVKSVNAGIDMFMEPSDWHKFMIDLKTAVKNGDVKESRINDAVKRILKIKFKAGLFKKALTDNDSIDTIGSQEHRAVAREAVRKSLVLLKNQNQILPLSKDNKFYITGSNADNLGHQCGGWTIKWQGFSGNQATTGTTIKEGIANLLQGQKGQIVNDLNQADVAIAVVGEKAYAEGKGDDADLELSVSDKRELQRIEESGKPMVVILVSGRPMIVSPRIENWDVFVAAWLPGTAGGGVADVIFGDYNFTGKLPVSWPRSVEQLPLNVGDKNYNPLFNYGYGLKMNLEN
ncbi:beta-glucosidase-like glycosyl hydrolase [Halobacteroides halobius DSM 5150]|uniref:beta-glucosidase n=1 Tax=Halobacteroides halobius (strain ATCC 35273 / DSM 5150 / MD-1) TaxID=748449 RepID=L0K850_HALHC|nr:glycoside hydrolase family 3 N-terminal domain-containing protein [Halobacteroides halobius]AGB40278.1 beta-glucosidase-like glycosyl hydrolase [Halobacteroides halobius DSM 5150]